MLICLTIATITITTCVQGAQPIGDCQQRMAEVTDCTIEADELLIRGQWYYPPLGGTNCQDPCYETGDGTHYTDCLNWCLACPLGWYGRWIEFDNWIGRWQCRDHGGGIKVSYGEYFTQHGRVTGWVILVDFLVAEEPAWAYWFLEWQFG
jgi:hypothetical protein